MAGGDGGRRAREMLVQSDSCGPLSHSQSETLPSVTQGSLTTQPDSLTCCPLTLQPNKVVVFFMVFLNCAPLIVEVVT